MVVTHKETQWCKAVWALMMCHGDEVTVAAPSASGITVDVRQLHLPPPSTSPSFCHLPLG